MNRWSPMEIHDSRWWLLWLKMIWKAVEAVKTFPISHKLPQNLLIFSTVKLTIISEFHRTNPNAIKTDALELRKKASLLVNLECFSSVCTVVRTSCESFLAFPSLVWTLNGLTRLRVDEPTFFCHFQGRRMQKFSIKQISKSSPQTVSIRRKFK